MPLPHFAAASNDVQEIYLPNGTRIIWGRTSAVPTLRLHDGPKPLVVMHFTLAGIATVHIPALNLSVDIRANEHNLIYPGRPDCWLDIPLTQSCEFLQIHVATKFFSQLSAQYGPTLHRLAELVRTRQPAYLMPDNLPVTPAMHTVLAQITKCPLTCSLKRLFLEAKVVELLALQLGQYEQNLTEAAVTDQPPEYAKLVEVRRLLESRFDNPPTLAELSRLVGLNEFKLKQSFKKVFGDTIYGWVLNYRLDHAYQMLQRHQLSISEVAWQVGYQHPAHFATAFKKKFGIVPSAVR